MPVDEFRRQVRGWLNGENHFLDEYQTWLGGLDPVQLLPWTLSLADSLERWLGACRRWPCRSTEPMSNTIRTIVEMYANGGRVDSTAPFPVEQAALTPANDGVALMLYNGSTYEAMRTVDTLKNAVDATLAAGASLTLWTPVSGKRFRLRGVAGSASVGGAFEIYDGDQLVATIFLNATAVTARILDLPANGYLSEAADNVLSVKNTTGNTASVRFQAWGNEE